MVEAEVKGKRVRVRLAAPEDFREGEKIKVLGRELHYHFIRIGNPHVVIFVEGLPEMPVPEIGKAVRFHERFKPAGTNVNFVEVSGPKSISVRTYERGVEEETLACGTGTTASAVVSCLVGYTSAPVDVKTRGGEILTVDFKKQGERVEEVFLEGEANLVFEGKLKA
jgi:diaminopimelate epimerase